VASRNSPAFRRYIWRFTPMMAGYVFVLTGVILWLESAARPTGPLLYLVAAAPAAPILGVIWAMGRYLVEETDEYQKVRLISAILWASGLTLAITTVWGFLQAFAHVQGAPTYYVFIIFCAALLAVQAIRAVLERR